MTDLIYHFTVVCPICLCPITASAEFSDDAMEKLDKLTARHFQQNHPLKRSDAINWTPEVEELRQELSQS